MFTSLSAIYQFRDEVRAGNKIQINIWGENIAESIRMNHKKMTLTLILYKQPVRTGNITSGQYPMISFCVDGAQHYGFIETEIL
jgi:hypothetical protein